MTSAPSHRPPSSGNDRTALALVALVLALMGGCRGARDAADTPDVVVRADDAPDVMDTPDTTDAASIDTALLVVPADSTARPVDTASVLERPDIYRIAVVLPFFEDSMQTIRSTPRDEEADLPVAMLRALDFHRGLRLALGHDTGGPAIALDVYDSKGSEIAVRHLTRSWRDTPPHLVIGPYFLRPTKVLSTWSRENEVYMVSPFTPSFNVAASNPYYVNAAPTLYAHLHAQAQAIGAVSDTARVIILHRDDDREADLSMAFTDFLNGRMAEHPEDVLVYADVTIDDNDENDRDWEVADHLEDGMANHVLIPSMNAGFVSNLLRRLKEETDDHDIILHGLPTWIENDNYRLEYFEDLRLHTTDMYHAPRPDAAFDQAFQAAYDLDPDLYARSGHDVGRFVIDLLTQHGHQPGAALKEVSTEGLVRSFDMTEVLGDAGQLLFYGNQAVTVYRLTDYDLVPLDSLTAR